MLHKNNNIRRDEVGIECERRKISWMGLGGIDNVTYEVDWWF